MLHALGMPELISDNIVQYEEAAVRLATDRDSLERLKVKLGRNRLTNPLFNSKKTTLAIEAAYRKMMEVWMAGRAPEFFSVD